MHWTDIAGAITELAAYPIGIYYVYFNPKSKFHKKTWVLFLFGVGLLVSIAHISLGYLDKERARKENAAQLREKVKRSVDQRGTLSTKDAVFESPDGYRILIPAGYTYSQPTGTPFSLIAIKNANTVQTPVVSVMTVASNSTNEEFAQQIKDGMAQKNGTTKFTDPVKIKNGATELELVEMSSVRDTGPIKSIVLFATKSGKNYAVILGAKEEMYAAAKPEFERIVSSFSFDKPEDKPVASQASSAPPPKAADSSAQKPEAAPQVATTPAATAASAPSAPAESRDADREAKAKVKDEMIVRQRVEAARESEARRKLKETRSKCVYKPIMTNDDLANCR